MTGRAAFFLAAMALVGCRSTRVGLPPDGGDGDSSVGVDSMAGDSSLDDADSDDSAVADSSPVDSAVGDSGVMPDAVVDSAMADAPDSAVDERTTICTAVCENASCGIPWGDADCVETCRTRAADCSPMELADLAMCAGLCDSLYPCVAGVTCAIE